MARDQDRSGERLLADYAGPLKTVPTGDGLSIRPVSPNPYRFRTGHWVIVVESVVLMLLGAGGLVANLRVPGSNPAGAPLWVLHVTELHAVVLLATGLLGLACAWRRRTALVFVGGQAIGYTLLFVIGVTAAARHVPTAMGFDYPSAVLHGALAVLGLALGMWLAGQALEGRWWVRR
jgi:hypothetical protein